MEFKGTKEKLEIKGNCLFIKGTSQAIGQSYVIDNYEKITFKPKKDIEAEANLLLWKKAPEMLDMLKELYGVVSIYNENNSLPQYITNEMAKTRKLIKEATDL
jgi:hypothetical protein